MDCEAAEPSSRSFSPKAAPDWSKRYLGVVQGEYHWHKHDDDDEFFYVVEGSLLIDLEERTVELGPRQGFVIPRGVKHRTRAAERTVMLMVENDGIVPSGN